MRTSLFALLQGFKNGSHFCFSGSQSEFIQVVSMLMSYRAYARHRNVTLRAVQKAIESGRIEVNEHKKIDQEKADRMWLANTDQSRASMAEPIRETPAADYQNKVSELSLMAQNSGGLLNRPTQIPPLPPEKKFESVASGGEDGETTDPDSDSAEYRKHRAIREKANAERARFELDELKGRLISKDFAVQAVFTAFRAIRDAVLNVAPRLKEEVAAEVDSDACEQLLETELTRALTSVDLTRIFSAEELE